MKFARFISNPRIGLASRRFLLATIICAWVASLNAGQIRLSTGKIDTSTTPEVTVSKLRELAGSDRQSMAIVQFSDRIQPQWTDSLKKSGAKVHFYLPDDAYLVSFPATSLSAVRSTPSLQWIGSLPPELKIARPLTKASLAVQIKITILSIDSTAAKALVQRGIAVSSTRMTQMGWQDTRATIQTSDLGWIAQLGSVFYIEPQPNYKMRGEREAQTIAGNYPVFGPGPSSPGYAAWQASNSLNGGSGLIVQVQDSGLDRGIATNVPGTAHQDIIGRIAGIFNATNDASGNDTGGHGTLNVGVIMGNATIGTMDSEGYLLGMGVAPQASVYATKIFKNQGDFEIGAFSFTDLAKNAQDAGALFSSNSWGESVEGRYTAESAEFDALTRDADVSESGPQPMTYVFAAGNSGFAAGTMNSPASAKNVISVGASENSDADLLDGCFIDLFGSDSMYDLAYFSSRGPTEDGRYGVTVVAPGTHVFGPASTDVGYDGSIVCDRYWPFLQTNYARSSGTSHSTPLVSGAVMMIYEFFNTQLAPLGHTAFPGPALLRAVLTNTATDIEGGDDGTGEGTTIPNVPNGLQGWGSADLTRLIDMKNALFSYDEGTVFTFPSMYWERVITPIDPLQPIKITVAWTDVPAAPLANPVLVNDLDLVVLNGGNTYRGNNFSNGYSVTGGTADHVNNLEAVYIQNPSGVYTVRVLAYNIGADGVPGNLTFADQDFAVFVWNGLDQTAAGIINIDNPTVNCSDSFQVLVSDKNLQGVPMITVQVSSSIGDSESLQLNETSPGTGVLTGIMNTGSGAPAADGILQVANGGTVTATYNDANRGDGQPRTVTDTVPVDCAPPIVTDVNITNISTSRFTVTFQTNEGAACAVFTDTSCGGTTLTRSTPLGTSHSVTFNGLDPCTTYYIHIEATDAAGNTGSNDNGGVCFQARTLTDGTITFNDDFEPSPLGGWSHAAQTAPDNWASRVNAFAHSTTHVFSYEPGVAQISDARLVTPLVQGGGELSFWHTYDLEVGYDGGVVEISTNGGSTWTDLGPHIVQGGYTGNLSTLSNSPIGGQKAWTGGSLGAMTQVRVDLSLYPGPVLIGFHYGSDEDVASVAWLIDDVIVRDTKACLTDAGTVRMTRDFYACSDLVNIELRDANAPTTAQLILITTDAGDSENVLVADPDVDKLYTGSIIIGNSGEPITTGDNRIQGSLLETIHARYNDADTSGGLPGVATDVATLDCQPPIISNIGVINNNGANQFTVGFNTNEPATGATFAAVNCGDSDLSGTGALGSAHTITVAGGTGCSTYTFRVEATDRAGNLAIDDNGGACYTVNFGSQFLNVFTDTFDGPPSGWFATGLWHLVSPLSSYYQANSPTRSWWYGSESTGTYNDPANQPNYGELTSPLIALPQFAGSITLTFSSWEQTQGFIGFDTRQIYVNNGAGAQLVYDSLLEGSAWSQVGPIDLTSFAGDTIQVTFQFNTLDETENDFRGWYIDDVVINAIQSCPTPSPTPPPNAAWLWENYE